MDAAGYFALMRDFTHMREQQLGGQPSDRALARRAGVSATTVGAWLKGAAFPKDADKVVALVEFVRAEARRQGRADTVPRPLLDTEVWRQAYRREADTRAGQVGASVRAAQARDALADDRPGRPVSEYVADPLLLEVQRAIEPAVPTPGLSALPVYVPRPHDARLAAVVERVTAGGSALVMLVGGSSTGKTRACWEAVSALGDRWRLWYPISPSEPRALLDGIAKVRGHTVIWLDEGQRYLGPRGAGEAVAARLRELLRSAEAAPVLLIGTMWPRYWGELTAQPRDGKADPHHHARALLTGCEIDVPDTFTGEALAAFREAGTRDPRLARAVQDVAGGELAQYLAGAPAQLSRYRTAPPTARAMIHAAMDACRLGMGAELSAEFLAGAASGYLTDLQWAEAPEGWAGEALAYTSAPCRGVLGPLSRIRRREPVPGAALREPARCVLAGYVDQTGRVERKYVLPPESFWAAALALADRGEKERLAGEARSRGHLRWAAELLRSAVREGSAGGASSLLSLVCQVSPETAADAAAWLVENACLESADEVWFLARRMQDRDLGLPVGPLLLRAAAEVRLDGAKAVADLLLLASEAGAEQAVSVLLARSPASLVPVADVHGAAQLLARLGEVSAREQVGILADRVAAHHAEDAGSYWAFGMLLNAGAGEAVARTLPGLLARLPLDRTYAAGVLLTTLGEAAPGEPLSVVAERDFVSGVDLEDPDDALWLLRALHAVGAAEQAAALLDRMRTYAAGAGPAWLARLHMMAWELRLADSLAERLPVLPPTARIDLGDTETLDWLLEVAQRTGAEPLLAACVRRSAADPAAFPDAERAAACLRTLTGRGATELAREVAVVAAAHTVLEDPGVAAVLARALDEAGGDADVSAFLARGPAASVAVTDAMGVAEFVEVLRKAGAQEQIATLLGRGPAAATSLVRAEGAARLLAELRHLAGAEDVREVADRAVREADATAWDAARALLLELHAQGCTAQLALYSERVAAAVAVSDPWEVGDVLAAFREVGQPGATARFLSRGVVAAMDLGHQRGIDSRLADILGRLRELGAEEQMASLTARIAQEADLTAPGTYARLAALVAEFGTQRQADAMAERAADSGDFWSYLSMRPQHGARYAYGREPDGRTPSAPWNWHSLS
ncbi:hypothetical protein [Streptomyces sp. IBSBF 2435]|uniref:hypothetical protein n=1 Tax=Streptomyces sp. IBSBF 2435 TaxID=2903531 RepID=UPI002FDBB531